MKEMTNAERRRTKDQEPMASSQLPPSANNQRPIFDLTQPIHNRMPVYPGDPEPCFQPAAGLTAPWKVSELHLGTHTGTHIDAPAHFFPNGKTIDQYSPARFVLPGMATPQLNLVDDEPIFWEASF